jgi:hypothetical protein
MTALLIFSQTEFKLGNFQNFFLYSGINKFIIFRNLNLSFSVTTITSSSSTLSLTATPDSVGGQRHVPATLLLGKRSGTHCIEGVAGSQGQSGRVRKNFLLPPEFEPRTVHPVAKTEVLREKIVPVPISSRQISH